MRRFGAAECSGAGQTRCLATNRPARERSLSSQSSSLSTDAAAPSPARALVETDTGSTWLHLSDRDSVKQVLASDVLGMVPEEEVARAGVLTN